MEDHCFYCHDEVNERFSHGLFIHQNEHVDKALCQDCYKEWLEGMKE
ncbi:hypothetical protein [Halalkalibacter okhensis]|nr:hypothetical protein [Halalkalibacter okhensis]